MQSIELILALGVAIAIFMLSASFLWALKGIRRYSENISETIKRNESRSIMEGRE